MARLEATGVAVFAGLAQQTYSSWENGTRPSWETVLAVADFYGVELLWLLTGKGPKRKAAPGAIPSPEAIREMREWMERVLP